MKKLKKIGVLLLAVIMLIQSGVMMVSADEAEKELIYTDPDVKAVVSELREYGLFDLWVTTETFFTEEANVTRVEAAEALIKLLGYENMVGGNNGMFYDVPDYHEKAGVISAISSMGVMTGAGDGLFNPDGEILKSEFVKAIVYSLGYGWRAAYEGGYPTGYMTIANRIGLLDGVAGDASAPLTRAELVKILKNSLNIPVYNIVSVSGETVELSIDANETLLTYFHKVYSEKGIVNSNMSVSLVRGFFPDTEKVLIGDREVYVGNVIDVYDYFGYEVEYRYHHNVAAEKYELLKVTPTNKNNVVEFIWSEIQPSSDAGKIVVYDEDGDDEEYTVSPSATYIYNKEQINRNIDEKIASFNGKMRMVDRNKDSKYDIVFIEDYIYDKVTANSLERNKTLYCEAGTYDFSAAEIITATSADKSIGFDEIAEDSVVEITQSADGRVVNVEVLNNVVTVSQVSRKEKSIIADDGTEFYYGRNLSSAHKDDIKNSPSVSIVLNSANEIVWVTVGSQSNLIGYLIKGGVETEAFESDARIKLLSSSGDVVTLECAEKVKVDGERMDEDQIIAKLTEIRSGLNLASDGTMAQIITYSLNDEGEIKEIGTQADPEGITMNLNYKDYVDGGSSEGATVRVWWGGTGALDQRAAISSTVPVFKVPMTGQDTADDKFFTVQKNIFSDGQTYRVDQYSSSPDKIDPCAFVRYDSTASATEATYSTNGLLLIEEVIEVLDDGMAVTKIAGWNDAGRSEWLVDVDPLPDIDTGDLCMFLTDGAGTIIDIKKGYDYETDTVLVAESGQELLELHVYDAPAGSAYIKTYKRGFEDGIPADEYAHLFALESYTAKGRELFHFDRKTKEIGKGIPPMLVTAKQDPVNYSKIMMLSFINSKGYLLDAVIYY